MSELRPSAGGRAGTGNGAALQGPGEKTSQACRTGPAWLDAPEFREREVGRRQREQQGTELRWLEGREQLERQGTRDRDSPVGP